MLQFSVTHADRRAFLLCVTISRRFNNLRAADHQLADQIDQFINRSVSIRTYLPLLPEPGSFANCEPSPVGNST